MDGWKAGWMGGWITSLDHPQVWFIQACIGGGLAQVIYKIFKHAVYGDRFKSWFPESL
jgi:hypothetical protein